MPKLYMSETSPPVRGVLLTAKALNIDLEQIILDTHGKKEHLNPEFIKLNPQHTIPTLIDDDGTIIWESHVIMSYLVGKYGKTDELYPKDLKKRAIVDQRMYFETEKVFGNIRMIVVSLKEKKIDKILPESKETFNSIYEFLNAFIGDNNYVAGSNLTIADFSLITTTQILHHLVPVDEKYANVHRWFKTMQKIPYYNIVDEVLQKVKKFMESFGIKFVI